LKTLLFLLALVCFDAHAAECTLYEQSHPAFLLDGSHLSTGKCGTCASCHINSVFTGTPTSCVQCHNGDPSRLTVGRSAKHIPTALLECSYCHTTLSFTVANMNHIPVTASGTKCVTCHLTGTSWIGSMQKMAVTHEQRSPVPTDCSMAGCHRPLGNRGTLYRNWD
jgi:hypothetical protein